MAALDRFHCTCKDHSCILFPPMHLETERVNENTFGRPNWFNNVKEEHNACRNNVALFDMSAFAKFEIEVSET